MVKKTKLLPTEWEEIVTNPTSDRGLISKIYKELKKLGIKIQNNPIKNGIQIYKENCQEKNLKWLKDT